MDFLVFVLLSTVLIGALWGIAAALLYPRLRPRVARLRPDLRTHLLWVWSTSPLMVGGCLTLLLFIPYSPLSFSHGDHCESHPACGSHLSQIHLPLPEGTSIPELISLPLLAAVVLFLFFQISVVYRGFKFRRNLQAFSSSRFEEAHLLASDRPLALSVGLLRPQIYISKALEQGLSEGQFQIVLAHEQAHVKRHDGLRRYLAEAGSFLHLSRTRRLLLSDLALATEQTCDEMASRALGNRLEVAETILAVKRLMQPHGPVRGAAVACYFSNHSVARVQSLLESGSADKKRMPLLLALPLVTVLAGIVYVEPLHHGTEWLLRSLLLG